MGTEEALACVDDYEKRAREKLPPVVYDYYAGGSGEEWTLRENHEAFSRWVIRPRVLVDVSQIDLSVSVLGREAKFPVLVAPTAFQRMAHPEGEVAAARAAERAGSVFTLSTIASSTIEEVAEATPAAAKWFQLYIYRDRDVTAELVKRAFEAGFDALVLTVDTPVLGLRDRDARNRFVLPEGVELANLAGLGAGTKLPRVEGSGLFAWVRELQDPAVTWDDIAWLRSLSPLPLALKGIMTREDARRAVSSGADAVIVSNHGGRQLDGTRATIAALPEVAEEAGDRLEVLLDGGIRRGSDALKALALGARAVLVGRPVLWGLAVDGERGAYDVLEILRHELDVAMSIAGCRSVGGVGRDLIAAAP
ncbi:MAG: alpha-hydroxy acid oxidase [Actinomycetota bacterium]